MKRILLLTSLLFVALYASAQSRFIPHIESQNAGEGTVTITQDIQLTKIINGDSALVDPTVKAKKEVDKTEGMGVVQEGRKAKIRGYRVQVYWGGSKQSDKIKAQQAGARVTALFPELEAYTSFESPHWRCRVGDFRDRREAASYLSKMRKANLAKDGMVVKSEIFVYQHF